MAPNFTKILNTTITHPMLVRELRAFIESTAIWFLHGLLLKYYARYATATKKRTDTAIGLRCERLSASGKKTESTRT